MGYERYPRSSGNRDFDYGRDYGSGRDYSYSSARDYEAAGEIGGDRSRDDRGNRDYYRDRGQGQHARGEYGAQAGRSDADAGYRDRDYRGSYAHDGHRTEDYGRYRGADDDNRFGRYAGGQRQDGNRGPDRGYAQQQRNRGDYGRQPQGYDYDDRGFLARAGDEVRSWFGDDDAERRREADQRYDEQRYGHRDRDYDSWRRTQIQALDRDYDEYRRENQSKFHSEFSTWRTGRQGQRDALAKVTEHMDVVGADGDHVGTVDKVRGDRILLTKNDADAGGRHHSIPSSWIASVDGKVALSKSTADAKQAWQDEDRNQAMFGYGDNARNNAGTGNAGAVNDGGNRSDDDRTTLNRSFSGTY